MGQIPSTGDLLAEPQDKALVEIISRPDRRIALGRTSDTTLDYRASAAVEASKRRLSAAVRHRERTYLARAWSMLAGGVAALLAGPVLVAGCVLSLAYRWGAHQHTIYWTIIASLATLALVPVLFWLERRSARIELEYGSSIADAATMTPEVLLWGPRQVMSARERLSETVSATVVTEAIATINYLRHFDYGVGTDELPTIQPLPVLRYLLSRGWVEVSEAGDQVRLLTEARQMLGLR
jgi:MFS family permease